MDIELENKKEKRNPSPPPGWAESSPRPLSPPVPATPSPSAHLRPTPRSRPLPLADWPHRSAAPSSSPRTALSRSPLTTVPSLAPSPRPSPRRTGKFGTAPSSPLDRVLARYRPVVRSRRRRCAAFTPALCTSPASAELHRSPPRAPIKWSPRAPLRLAPTTATPLPPHPSNRASAAVFLPSGKPFLLLSLSLWWFSEKLKRLINFATPPRTWDTTPLPQSPLEAHRWRLPPQSSATSPRSAPSRPPLAKLSPPLSSPAPPHARVPARYPRTRLPAANRR
jgi:hypothetical protein